MTRFRRRIVTLALPLLVMGIYSGKQHKFLFVVSFSKTQRQYSNTIYQRKERTPKQPLLVLPVSKLSDADSVTSTSSLDDDDKKLLSGTDKGQLVQLCQQFVLPFDGTKEEMLIRLRSHAQKRIEEECQRMADQKIRIEEGGGQNDREKYEIINPENHDDDATDDDNDESDAYFYFGIQESFRGDIDNDDDNHSNNKNSNSKWKEKGKNNNIKNIQQVSDNRPITRESLTAPPLPPGGIKPDENGERVVTVYSTSDQNDLTGLAAAQPGNGAAQDPMTGSPVEPENTVWDFQKDQNNMISNQKPQVSEYELESAKEDVIELVQNLLAMTGAPGFANFDDDDGDETSSFAAPQGFVGFDPGKLPTDFLSKASKSIRTGRGSVLADVTRDFEIRAVGYDGAIGDDEKRGGGHYRQVALVRSFLEGYRRAEVRRLARGTATMLLDRLVTDGIEGLDSTISLMTRMGDDTNQEAGELNDSLLDYLNDAIRQQENKVDKMLNSLKKVDELERSIKNNNAVNDFDQDQLEQFWTVGNEDGKRIETFDPKDPETKIALQDEYEKTRKEEETVLKRAILPNSAPEKLLVLLKLLRERIKIEAAFPHDEKSKNLRVLAYCLNLNSDKLRKELIVKEFGSSLDRLDSFAELVSSSIEYGESTSHQVQPNKVVTLNVPLLERIFVSTKEAIKEQSYKASTGKSTLMP